MAILNTKPKGSNQKKESLSHFLDIISPTVLDFQARQTIMGDQYQRALVIMDYPPEVKPGWLARIANLPGVVCSIHAVPTDNNELLDQMRIDMGNLQGRMEEGGNPYSIREAGKKFDAAEKLLDKIDQEQQNVFFMTVVLNVTANTPDELERRVKSVQSAVAGSRLRARPILFKQKETFLSSGPWGMLDKDVAAIGARNVPSESLAAAFPYSYSGLNDGAGILIGKDKDGGIVLLDIWKRGEGRTNSNMLITGRPGVGKSTLVKLLAFCSWALGIKVIIVDPEREYKELCEKVNGSWIDCGGGSKGRINPLQVLDVPLDEDLEDDEEPLYSEELAKRGPLSLHFQTLRVFFKCYLREISKTDQSYLEIALEAVYEKFDITWTTDPKTIPNDKWPLLKDLYEWLDQKAKEQPDKPWDRLAVMLRSAAIGADSALWGGHTTLKADSDFVVLDTLRLINGDKEIQASQYFNLMTWTWNEISANRMEQVLVFFDEGYLCADPEIPQILQALRNFSKRIRKYEGGIGFITHNFEDLLDPAVRRHGQALIDNPTYKFLLGQGDKDLELLSQLMALSEKEIQTISEGKRGEAILVAGNRRLLVQIEPDEFELELMGKAGGR